MAHNYAPPMSPGGGYLDSQSLGQPSLKKGRACVNCRRRKMRCDGAQPICGACYRTSKAEDCEYTNGSEQSTSQKLEQEIERIQSRLHRLQTSAQPSPPVALQQPYVPEHLTGPPRPDFQEPPSHIIKILVDVFLTHASQYGFFLHPGRFRNSVLLSGPRAQISRPPPSLLSVTYLLGIHLSQDPEMKKHEKTYFDSTLSLLAQDTLSTERHPQYRLHVIQTEVLLSYYFFANKRVMEGKYHMSCAFSLGIASGIHRMRIRNPPESTLPPANDDIEEGERVNAWWTIFALDKGWAGVLDCTPNSQRPSLGGAVMVTPLPREIEEYETGRYRCEQRNNHSFHDFLSSTEARGEVLCSRTLHAKAAFLFERARMFSRALGTDIPQKHRKECGDSFYQLRNVAMSLKSSLPPFEAWLRNPNMDIVRTAYIGTVLLDAALIRFHGAAAAQGDEKARQLRVISAQEIFTHSINLAASSWNFRFLNPVIGFAWREAFEVLFEELSAHGMQPSWAARSPMSGEDPLRRQLRKGVSSFAVYSNSCAFIGNEVKEMTSLLQGAPVGTM